MNYYTILLLRCLHGLCLGQSAPTNRVSTLTGQVVDGMNKPLPGVTVQLMRPTGLSAVTGTQTDSQGTYQFTGVGTYFLQFSAIGMKPTRSAPFTLTDADSSRNCRPSAWKKIPNYCVK